MKYRKLKLIIFIITLVALGLRYLSGLSSKLTETIYSLGFYRVISLVGSKIFGIFKFSVAELIVILLFVGSTVLITRFIIRLIRDSKNRKVFFINSITNLLTFIMIVYSMFIILWGINYNRKTAFEIFDLEKKDVSIEVIDALVYDLTLKAEIYRNDLEENENGVVISSFSLQDNFEQALNGYYNVSLIFPELSGNYSQAKPIYFSKYYSYTNIYGVYSPFTFEANINTNIPSPLLLSTICHEMAHQRGFAREDEANYIAYLTAKNNESYEFKYSGYLLALIQSMNILRRYDSELYNDSYERLAPGIKRDLDNISEFSDKYESLLDDFSSFANDIFLKSNGQKDGTKSYGRMVDLLVAEYLSNG